MIAKERRAFRIRLLAVGAAIALLALILQAPIGDQAAALAVVPLAVGCWWCYYVSHRRLADIKAREGWYSGVRQTVTVDTTLRTEPVRFPWLWTIPAFVILAATIVIGIVRYPDLPTQLAVHFGKGGQADRWTTKSFGAAFTAVFIQAGMTLLLLGLAWYIPRIRADIDAEHTARSSAQHREFVRRMTRQVPIMVAFLNLTLLFVSLMVWGVIPAGNGSQFLVLGSAFAGVIVFLIAAVRAGQGGSRLHTDTEDDDQGTGRANRDDDKYWRAGVFYVNPDDPSLWVPKRFGIGWTLNLGRPGGWIAVGVLILLPAVIIFMVR